MILADLFLAPFSVIWSNSSDLISADTCHIQYKWHENMKKSTFEKDRYIQLHKHEFALYVNKIRLMYGSAKNFKINILFFPHRVSDKITFIGLEWEIS